MAPNNLFYIGLFVISILSAMYFNTFESNTYFFPKNKFEAESSVWCTKGKNNTNLCNFKNLCYDINLNSLLFFLGEGTVIKGLQNYSELQKIQLSSIADHNQFYANITVIDANTYKFPKVIDIQKKVFLMSRFKPNNIMHIIHDDLFPLFLTLQYLCIGNRICMDNFRLVIHDHHPPGSYFDLYALLFRQPPIFLNSQFRNIHNILCFQEISTGLVQDGIFYQYGFKKTHGPVKNNVLQYNDISMFANFIKEKLHFNILDENKFDIVIIKRQKTRKILNIDDVVKMAELSYKKIFGMNKAKIVVLNLQNYSVQYLVQVIATCKLLIGMHGAEMILTLFSKPNSIVIELFPFGIQPENVSFLKSICDLEGSHLFCFSWVNHYQNNSLGHPDTHPLLGGIYHLDKETRKKILNTQIVPAVECCNDPNYLFHMFQDTWVHTEFENFLQTALFNVANSKMRRAAVVEKWLHPSAPLNVKCEFHSTHQLVINWHHPFNINDTNNLEYNIFIQYEKYWFQKNILTNLLTLVIDVPLEIVESCPKFHLWISVFYTKNGSKSKDSYYQCSCT